MGKIKKTGDVLQIELDPGPDILRELGRDRRGEILVGFAAETDSLVHNARGKLERKNLDFIVANDVSRVGSGFDVDTNTVVFVWPGGETEALPPQSKDEVARALLDRVRRLREARA